MSTPREDLGQHLLKDLEAIAIVLDAAKLQPGEVVLDAGAGKGALTHPISEAVGPTGRVHAVEVDPLMVEALKADLPENVRIVQSDLLEVSLRDIQVIVANPPFKIVAPFIERIIASKIKRAVLVVPRELSDRLTAPPGSERYGALTIRVRILADVAFISPLSRRAFRPAPGVDCSLISVLRRKDAEAPDPAALKMVLDTATAAWGRKAKYALATLPDMFRADSTKFQQMLRDESWAEEVVSALPPRAFAAITKHLVENARVDAE